jgi:hypothetical protein
MRSFAKTVASLVCNKNIPIGVFWLTDTASKGIVTIIAL